MIPIGKLGYVLEGKDAGSYVLVLDDTAGRTGGYYIFTSDAPNFNTPSFTGQVYDYWVEHKEDLDNFFHARKMKWDVGLSEPGD